MKICTIVGARPQFIKAATVSRAIASHNGRIPDTANLFPDAFARQVENRHSEVRNVSRTISEAKQSGTTLTEIIIHTGQHYDEEMSDIFFRELAIPEPAYNLGVGSGAHGVQTGQMLMAIENVLLKEKPDWVLIYGDTNSTLAGALAAAKLHIPIAHVEAGLRSFNRLMPEEINRIVADHLSDLLFCPSQVAADNLAVEGIVKGVTIVGDVMSASLKFAVCQLQTNNPLIKKLNLKHKDFILVTIHRAENTDDTERLLHILNALNDLEETIVLPIHPRTKKILQNLNLSMKPHIRVIDPVGYFDMIALERSARMILTDSGGIQKEAYWLNVPCVTLRDETEWVETVEGGWNILTGANKEKINNAVRNFTPPKEHPSLYGDGHAAEKIVKRLVIGCRS